MIISDTNLGPSKVAEDRHDAILNEMAAGRSKPRHKVQREQGKRSSESEVLKSQRGEDVKAEDDRVLEAAETGFTGPDTVAGDAVDAVQVTMPEKAEPSPASTDVLREPGVGEGRTATASC